jgi:hypothetical protein
MTGFTGFRNPENPLPAIPFIFLPVSGSSQKKHTHPPPRHALYFFLPLTGSRKP